MCLRYAPFAKHDCILQLAVILMVGCFVFMRLTEPASKGKAGKKEVGPSRMAQELSTADVAPVVVIKG
jgi:hypothetical protein